MFQIRKAYRVLVIYFVIYVVVFLTLNIYTTGISALLSDHTFDEYEPDIVTTGNINRSDTLWISTTESPYIVISCHEYSMLAVNIEYLNYDRGASQNGKIYFSETPDSFEGTPVPYRFHSQENMIRNSEKGAGYMKLELSDKQGVHIRINGIKEYGGLRFCMRQNNHIAALTTALMLAFFLAMVFLADKYKEHVDTVFWLILFSAVGAVFWKFITGTNYYMYTDVGGDTVQAYYPFYINAVSQIRNGTLSEWNWNSGLGVSETGFGLWGLDPFAVIPVLSGVISGQNVVAYFLVWMQIAKIITIFFFSKKFLSFYLQDRFAVNLGAFTGAWNGYLMLWGQHYFLGTGCVYAIIFLYLTELYIHSRLKRGWAGISILTAGLLISSYYSGYMILIVMTVYFLYRYFVVIKPGKFFHALRDIAVSAGYIAIGIVMSAVIFLPSCYLIMTNSSRLDGADTGIAGRLWQSFLSGFSVTDIADKLSRYLSNNMLYMYTDSAEYYDGMLFCTIFIYFFLCQWIVCEIRKAKSDKTWKSLAVKMVLFSCFMFSPATSLVMNGFVAESYRYIYLVFPFLMLCTGIVWQDVIMAGRISMAGLLTGAVLSGLAVFHILYKKQHGNVNYIYLVIFFLIVGYLLLAVYACVKSKERMRFLVPVFAVLVAGTTVLDDWYTTNNRRMVERETFSLKWTDGSLDKDTSRAIRWLADYDGSMYRIEKMYGDWTGITDSMIEEYAPVSYYNSGQNRNVTRFYDYIYPDSYIVPSVRGFVLQTGLDQTALDLLNVKYLLSRYPVDRKEWEQVKQMEGVYIYRNLNTDSVAKWYTDTVTQQEFAGYTEDEKVNVLMNAVIVSSGQVRCDKNAAADISDFRLLGQSRMEGKVQAHGTGILMLVIPDQEGWSISVDGVEVERMNLNYGLTGVQLEEGKHRILAEYHTPYLKEGMMLSAAGVLILAALLVRSRYHAV